MIRRQFAARTEVPVQKSKIAIEQMLVVHGATKFATGWDTNHDTIQFELFKRTIRFVLPRPDPKQYRGTKKIEQADRQRWRALYLVIRAKIEAVEAGIAVFEQEFLAFVVMPNGLTIGDSLVPLLQKGAPLPQLTTGGGE